MEARQAMYDFVLGLVNMVTHSNGLWRIIGPFVLMLVIIRVVRWAYSTARGERDIDELHEQGVDNLAGLHNRINYGRNYHQLRGMGFNNSQLRQARRQRPGSRFRF